MMKMRNAKYLIAPILLAGVSGCSTPCSRPHAKLEAGKYLELYQALKEMDEIVEKMMKEMPPEGPPKQEVSPTPPIPYPLPKQRPRATELPSNERDDLDVTPNRFHNKKIFYEHLIQRPIHTKIEKICAPLCWKPKTWT